MLGGIMASNRIYNYGINVGTMRHTIIVVTILSNHIWSISLKKQINKMGLLSLFQISDQRKYHNKCQQSINTVHNKQPIIYR